MTNIQVQEATIAFDRMYEYAHLTPEQTVNLGLVPDSAFHFESLVINNLSFRFPGRPLLLESVSLTIRKGELVVLLGESGNGKSTLLQLLQRFYTAEAGQILLNGADWETIDTVTWRHIISVVPQQNKLFNGTLLDNICLGNVMEEAETIIQFCQQYGFDRYFDVFPQGYLTRLGEAGVNLSGGQRQLVALARALYRKPQLLLLDEPTAAMDKHMEQFVMNLLHELLPQMGILLITHKAALAQRADRVYELDNGRLHLVNTQTLLNENQIALESVAA